MLGKVPTISVEKTDGCQMYLSPESLSVEIVSAKSSEMNVVIPSGDDFVSLSTFTLNAQGRIHKWRHATRGEMGVDTMYEILYKTCIAVCKSGLIKSSHFRDVIYVQFINSFIYLKRTTNVTAWGYSPSPSLFYSNFNGCRKFWNRNYCVWFLDSYSNE